MTSILDMLENVQYNMETLGKQGLESSAIYLKAKKQLDNAIEALKDGEDPYADLTDWFCNRR